MTELHDPTRIPGVVGALQRAWEAQPNVAFPQLWAQLEARGVGFNSTDAELQRACADLLAEHPSSFAEFVVGSVSSSSLDATPLPSPRRVSSGDTGALGRGRSSSVVVECIVGETSAAPGGGGSAEQLLTLSAPHGDGAGWVLVRRAGLQPVVWRYARVVTCRAGGPVIIEDVAGNRHRLGLASRLSAQDFAMDAPELADELGRARRSSIGDRVYVVTCADGSIVEVDHGLRVYSPGRRDMARQSMKWARVARAAAGEPLVVVDAGGAAEELPVVEAVFRAE